MFCKKCDNQLNENVSTCPFCGSEVEQNSSLDEETAYAAENSSDFQALPTNLYQDEYQQSTKNRLKKPIIIGIAAAVLLLSCIGVYATTDIFKSPKQIYLQVEGKNIINTVTDISDNYKKNYEKKVKSLFENSYETKMEYSAKLNLSGLPQISPSTQAFNELLGNSKIVIDTKSNPVLNESTTDVGLIVKGNNLINANLIQEGNELALSIPVLYNKYLVLNMEDYASFMKKLGVKNPTQAPKKIITNKDIFEAIKIQDSQVMSLLLNYGKILNDSIDAKSVTLERNIDYKVNDINFNCRKLTVSMDEKTFKETLLKLVDSAQKDENFYNLTGQNIKNILKLYKDAGYYVNENESTDIEAELSKEKFQENIANLKKELTKELENVSLPEGIKMSLYIDGHTIIGRTIEFKVKNVDSNEITDININYNGVEKYKKQNIRNLEIKVKDSDEDSTAKFTYATKLDKNDGEVGKASIVISEKKGKFSLNVLNANVDINNTKDKSSQSQSKSYKYDVKEGENEKQFSCNGTVDINTWEKEKEKKYGSDVTVSFNTKDTDKNLNIGGSFNIKGENTMEIHFELPTVGKSVDIGQADDAKIKSIQIEIIKSIQKFMIDNKELFSGVM